MGAKLVVMMRKTIRFAANNLSQPRMGYKKNSELKQDPLNKVACDNNQRNTLPKISLPLHKRYGLLYLQLKNRQMQSNTGTLLHDQPNISTFFMIREIYRLYCSCSDCKHTDLSQ